MTDLFWNLYGIESPHTEYRFHPVRKWRFDYAWVAQKVAVEIDGAVWTRGRHTRGSGYVGDMEKLNMAQKMGWKVFRFVPRQIKSGEAQNFMKDILSEVKP